MQHYLDDGTKEENMEKEEKKQDQLWFAMIILFLTSY